MTMAKDIDLEEYIMAKEDLSGADIKVRAAYLHWNSLTDMTRINVSK
jgi:ATP-dependent 26S proteasome regulatory subunit